MSVQAMKFDIPYTAYGLALKANALGKYEHCSQTISLIISGLVDEKLPVCHFKKLEYKKLFSMLGYTMEYLYVFNDWFHDVRYTDTLNYIKDRRCHYFFNEIPLYFLNVVIK